MNGDHACRAGRRAHGADRCAGAREFYCVLSVECCVRESSSLALFTQATRLVLVLALVVVVVGGGRVTVAWTRVSVYHLPCKYSVTVPTSRLWSLSITVLGRGAQPQGGTGSPICSAISAASSSGMLT